MTFKVTVTGSQFAVNRQIKQSEAPAIAAISSLTRTDQACLGARGRFWPMRRPLFHAMGLFFLLFFVGGCAGSTAGAIKIFRWQLLLSSMKRQLILTFSPNRALPERYAGRRLSDDMMAGSVVGSGTNFSLVPDMGKWLLVLGMLLGRLELLTVYVLLLPDYWRD